VAAARELHTGLSRIRDFVLTACSPRTTTTVLRCRRTWASGGCDAVVRIDDGGARQGAIDVTPEDLHSVARELANGQERLRRIRL